MNFIARHGRTYSTKEEYQYRLSVFEKNFENIMSHNAKTTTYTKAVNHFTDMTAEEFNKNMKGGLHDPAALKLGNLSTFVHDGSPVANGIDWRGAGAVTGVKDQG